MKAFTSDQIHLVDSLWRANVETLLPIAKAASPGIAFGKKAPSKSYLIDAILRIIGEDHPPSRMRSPISVMCGRVVEDMLVKAGLAYSHHFKA